MRTRLRSQWSLAAGLLFACGGGDSFEPSVATVAGTYTATTFSVTVGGVTTNVLAAGGSLTLTLAADGTVAGHLFVPGGAEDGGDLDLDLSGTWELTGTTVTFTMPEDTFVRDAALTAERNRLRTDATFNEVTIRVVLSRAG